MFDHYKYTKVEFDWEIRISEFVIESANGFHLREIRSQDGFQQRNPNPDVVDFFLPFHWEIRKRICKTILVNMGLLFANYPKSGF